MDLISRYPILRVLTTTPGKVVQLEIERWGGNGPVDANEGVGLAGVEGRRERRREGRKERRREGAALHSPHGSTSSGLAPLSQSYYDSQTRCKP